MGCRASHPVNPASDASTEVTHADKVASKASDIAQFAVDATELLEKCDVTPDAVANFTRSIEENASDLRDSLAAIANIGCYVASVSMV